MARGDKPYRVYRGGRAKGRVPLQRRVEQTPRRDGRRQDRPVAGELRLAGDEGVVVALG